MKHLTLLLLLSCISLFAQETAKKQYFFNEKDIAIDKSAFIKKGKDPKHTYIPHIIENDTAIIGNLYIREETGVMSQADRQNIIKNLEALTNKKVSETQTIVIDFFCIPTPRDSYKDFFARYVNNNTYNRFFKKNENDFIHFFISQKGYTPEKFYEDKNEYFQKLFLNYIDGSNHYIIIKPNGHFLRRLSEHRQDEIIDKAKGDW
mgnify:CR=1 FL=1